MFATVSSCSFLYNQTFILFKSAVFVTVMTTYVAFLALLGGIVDHILGKVLLGFKGLSLEGLS